MHAPRVSHPQEPGLFARSPNLERYRVGVGGLTLIDLQPGDSLQVIDLEGRQPCELLALDSKGRSTLSDWALQGAPDCAFIPAQLARATPQARRIQQALSRRGINPQRLPHAASLWDEDSQKQ